METDFLSIGLRIKQIRNEKGLTQEQLAEIVNAHPVDISRIETGSNFTIDRLVKILNALEVSADYILADSTHPAEVDTVRGMLIDCSLIEEEFILKCAASIKEILTDYKLKK